ncbi:RES family NAD+ phosphorylase [Brevundimonas sp. PAMC22021]|uniref:RES family NAD+ phosphorylase n=1 Tax=Brevundimonas sp. PAMC22021 TaxID=2861285 RepID=UPI001C637E8A|nr:RES family NAD+ phosphorylase [Brevundimonas sp. PAMC22021]QYF86210.1 RES family NAD+ phosphorylase [Brevundimonas sp. PAMC22021]
MTVVCTQCFTDKGLRRRIAQERKGHDVGNCERHRRYKGVPVEVVAGIVDPVFRHGFGISDGSWHSPSGDSLETLLYELTGVEEEAVMAALIAALMEADDYWPADGGEPFYDETFAYVRSEQALWTHSALWERTRLRLLHGQRFFNRRVLAGLEEVFEGIHLQRGADKRAAVHRLAPGDRNSAFHRARIAETDALRSEIRADPVRKLGPPPERLRRPGRLNASGISAFYGSFDMATCVAELRPRVGAFLVGARFELTRPIVVLDMTIFESPPKATNRFANDHIVRLAQYNFLQAFTREIAQAVSPDDEHLDYVPTQAVAEYLTHHHEFNLDGRRTRIEAIIYRSAQYPKGLNIAILGEAARVGLSEADRKAASKPEPLSPFEDDWEAEPGEAAPIIVRPSTFEVRRVESASFSSPVIEDLGSTDWDDA